MYTESCEVTQNCVVVTKEFSDTGVWWLNLFVKHFCDIIGELDEFRKGYARYIQTETDRGLSPPTMSKKEKSLRS